MRATFLSLTFLVIVVSAALFGQDSIDDLFDDPDAGIVEEEPEEAIDIEDLTRQEGGPRFSGSASAEGGLIVGLTDWQMPASFSDGFSLSPFYEMASTLKIDARPTSRTRFFVSLGTSVPRGSSLVFDSFSINELFLDYTLAQTVFFRVGNQSARWGQGEIFNPANLVSDVSGSTSVKASFPLLGASGTLFAIARQGYFTNPELPGAAEIGFAGQFAGSVGGVSGGVASFFQANRGLRSSAYLKSVVAGVDVAAEGVVSWPSDFGSPDYDALLATYWEGLPIALVVVAEYLFESTRLPEGLGSTVGLGLGARDLLPDGWNPGIQWLHALYDGSGEVTLGLDGTIAENLKLSLGLPLLYGADGSHYRGASEDPENRVASLVARVTLSVSF